MQNIIAFSVGFACIFIAVSGNTHNLSKQKSLLILRKPQLIPVDMSFTIRAVLFIKDRRRLISRSRIQIKW